MSTHKPPMLELDRLWKIYDTPKGPATIVKNFNLKLKEGEFATLIGHSGCGKSTVLRSINRMNDLIPGARVTGRVMYNGRNLYDPEIDAVEVRRRIGMVFQKPNPFPKSIFDNVAYGPRLLGVRDQKALRQIVEDSLKAAFLWDEVKGDLKKSGLALSGGQQQRLCIARAIAVQPDVILMDEPCSALDPIATQAIEDLMLELVRQYTIIIVTHNMQQAQRVADYTAFFNIRKEQETGGNERRWGLLAEHGTTDQIFNAPRLEETERYISGEFG